MSEMVRIRLVVKAVLEYDADPEDYAQEPDQITAAEIAAMDQETAEEDIYMFLDNGDTQWSISVAPALAEQEKSDA